MARGPKPKVPAQAAALIEAINFVKIAAKDQELLKGSDHVRLLHKTAVCSNGQLSAGHPINEELTTCPHLGQLLTALMRCGKTLALTETDAGRLSVKGEKLRVLVPCLPAEDLPDVRPDNFIVGIDDRVKEALACCVVLSSENGERLIEASVLLGNGDCVGTNGAAMLNFWHGNELPPAMVLPSAFAKAVANTKQALKGFGASWDGFGKLSSVTFYFEGGAWLKTQTYADEWPDIAGLFNTQVYYAPTPAGFLEAIEAVGNFEDEGDVYFMDGAMQSSLSADVGAQYEVPGLQGGKLSNSGLWKKVGPWVAGVDLTSHMDRTHFISENGLVRGIVMGKKRGDQMPQNYQTTNWQQPEPTFAAQMEGDDEGDDFVDNHSAGFAPTGGFTPTVQIDNVPMPGQG